MAEKSRFVGCVFKQQGCRTGPLRTWLILRAGRIVKKYNPSVSRSLHSLTGSRAGRLDRAHRTLRLPAAGLAAVAARAAALIWILVRMDFLTVRGQVGCFTGLSIADDSQTLTLP